MVSVPYFKADSILWPVNFEETTSMVKYHCAVGEQIVHNTDIYISMCKSSEKHKIMYSNPPINKQLIVIDYCLKKIK